MTSGSVTYSIVGTTHTWSLAGGVTYVSTPEFSSDCPLAADQCPSGVDGPFLAMNGELAVDGIDRQLMLAGAVTTDGAWALFEADAGDVTFGGYGITDATLTLWHGDRADSYDPNMTLPSLATLNSGVDLEFCGGFTLPIPGHSNAATNGCARWSDVGVVLGQIGVAIDESATLPSTGSVASAVASVKGAAWTNLATSALEQLPSYDVIMSGVSSALANQTITLAGEASLPGVVADALNIDLAGAGSLVVDVTGSISASGFSLEGVIPTDIRIGSEPFQTNITSVTASIDVARAGGASFSIGTAGTATLGYGSNTRQITTSVQLVAATPPSAGMVVSVSAVGTKAAGDTGGDGLSSATRLSNPAAAQYVWPDQFGIGGMNLWSLTVQIGYVEGSPSLGYASTTYLDPNGAQTGEVIACAGPCDGADWMVGTLGFNISYTTPCFAYSFSSGSGTSGFSIDGGTITATAFKVGIAPAGCSIQTGGTQQSLPTGFAGFQFTAAFGDATLNVATEISPDGFIFEQSITNLTLAGITYEEVSLSITIDSSGSDIAFTAIMTSGMGDMSVSSDFSATSAAVTQALDATLTDWNWSSASVDIVSFHFSTSSTIPTTASGCASFNASADGQVKIAGSTITLGDDTTVSIDCDGVQALNLDLQYTHTPEGGAQLTQSLQIRYPYVVNGRTYLYGATEFVYHRRFSKKYSNQTFSRSVKITIGMQVSVDTQDPTKSGFAFGGQFEADRTSGAVGCSLPVDSRDFSCSGELRLNPRWAGIYRVTWTGL